MTVILLAAVWRFCYYHCIHVFVDLLLFIVVHGVIVGVTLGLLLLVVVVDAHLSVVELPADW